MRLIDADALRTNINNVPMHGDDRVFYDIMSELVSVVAAAPTIDPVRHARWVRDDTWRDLYFCSACIGRDIRNKPNYKYCPDCGARMDGEEKDG